MISTEAVICDVVALFSPCFTALATPAPHKVDFVIPAELIVHYRGKDYVRFKLPNGDDVLIPAYVIRGVHNK